MFTQDQIKSLNVADGLNSTSNVSSIDVAIVDSLIIEALRGAVPEITELKLSRCAGTSSQPNAAIMINAIITHAGILNI